MSFLYQRVFGSVPKNPWRRNPNCTKRTKTNSASLNRMKHSSSSKKHQNSKSTKALGIWTAWKWRKIRFSLPKNKKKEESYTKTQSQLNHQSIHSFSCFATHTRNSSEKGEQERKMSNNVHKGKKWSSTKEEKERHYQRNVCSKKCEIKWGLLKRKGNEKKKGHLLLQWREFGGGEDDDDDDGDDDGVVNGNNEMK